MPRLAPEWPRHLLIDPLRQVGAPQGLSGYDLASQESVRASHGHSGAVRTTSGHYEYVLVYSGMFLFVAKIVKTVRYLQFRLMLDTKLILTHNTPQQGFKLFLVQVESCNTAQTLTCCKLINIT